MKFRFCKITEESSELYYNYCDSNRGASGSGVYSRIPVDDFSSGISNNEITDKDVTIERRLTSIFSGHKYVRPSGCTDDSCAVKDYNWIVGSENVFKNI